MAFILNDFSPSGAQGRNGVTPQKHSYTTEDTLANIKNPIGYFNAVSTILSPDDSIQITSSTGATPQFDIVFVATIAAGVVSLRVVDITAV